MSGYRRTVFLTRVLRLTVLHLKTSIRILFEKLPSYEHNDGIGSKFGA